MKYLYFYAALPDQGPPKITGGRPRYQVGDWVSINCTAGRSKPAVQLSWFVNGDAAEPHQIRRYDTIVSGREGLETSVLGLQFRVEQYHFRNGDMKLKCVASLSTLYWRSNEESVEGDRPQKAPVLESRETVYASNSRADPVQGMSFREIFVTKILSFFIQPNAASKTDSIMVAHAPNIFLLLIPAVIIILLANDNCLKQFFLFLSCSQLDKCESTVNNVQLVNVAQNNKTHKKQEHLLCDQNTATTEEYKCTTDETIPPPVSITAASGKAIVLDDDDDDGDDVNDHNNDVITENSTLVFCCENTLMCLDDLMTENNNTTTTTTAIIKIITTTEMKSVR